MIIQHIYVLALKDDSLIIEDLLMWLLILNVASHLSIDIHTLVQQVEPNFINFKQLIYLKFSHVHFQHPY